MATVAVAMLAGLPGGSPAAQLRVSVGVDQRASVSGDALSLEALVRDLCWRAGVRLLAYDAVDRTVRVQYDDVSLAQLFTRLLRQESYMIGMRKRAAGGAPMAAPSVAWLRVVGEHERALANHAPIMPVGSWAEPFRIPPTLMLAAFAGDGGPKQAAAFDTLVARITGDPHELKKFLATDPGLIARSVQRFAAAPALLARLRDGADDAAVRGQLDAVLAVLGTRASD